MKNDSLNTVYLLLGSNLGDKLAFLNEAVVKIQEQIGPVVKKSSIYRTAAWGNTQQDDYYNQAIEIKTSFDAHQLLEKTQAVEAALGRIRTPNTKWMPRTIDIDILFFNSDVLATTLLVVPHPLIQERKFVLQPLEEIAPNFYHPTLSKRIADLNAELPLEGVLEPLPQ
ncbi:MAG: 2-amino-4-hydroxy-6-hydroxymethyldihydropteridine diphosphokinase [Bacteroidetes bacterium]|nr:2-amino-4-hydroxy-6-hydroxymethyldihydropteridine diphosphokinase [Bacteroidota bacterium]